MKITKEWVSLLKNVFKNKKIDVKVMTSKGVYKSIKDIKFGSKAKAKTTTKSKAPASKK